MSLNVLLASANLLQSCLIFVTLSACIPQWLTIYRCKSSANISLASWYMWLSGSSVSLFYAVVNQYAYGNYGALILTSCVSFSCNLYSICLIVKYREKKEVEIKVNEDVLVELELVA